MFDDNFSFGARSASLDSTSSSTTEESSRSVSPCSHITEYPPPQYTVTDLAASLGRSRLRQEAQICFDSCEAYANTDDDAGWQLDCIPTTESDVRPVSRARAMPAIRPHSPSRRLQRQSSARLLCSTAHHKDIAALVARMVTREEQCSVMGADARAAVTAAVAEEDEGYDSSENCDLAPSSRRSSLAASRARLDYRRSSELRTTGACINKSIRLRKEKTHKRRVEA